MDNEDRMQTVAGALEQFGGRGYREEMTVRDARLGISGTERTYWPDEVAVRDYWSFEGVSDPGDESVVYAIETSDGVEDTLVHAYNHGSPLRRWFRSDGTIGSARSTSPRRSRGWSPAPSLPSSTGAATRHRSKSAPRSRSGSPRSSARSRPASDARTHFPVQRTFFSDW